MKNAYNKILPFAALSLMGLFGTDKTYAQNDMKAKKDIKVKANEVFFASMASEISTKLPQNIVILSEYDLNPQRKRQKKSQRKSEYEEIMIMGDTVVVRDTESFLKNYFYRQQVNCLFEATAHRKPGELVRGNVVSTSQRENIDFKWYVQAKDGKHTPLEIFKQAGYAIHDFDKKIEKKIPQKKKKKYSSGGWNYAYASGYWAPSFARAEAYQNGMQPQTDIILNTKKIDFASIESELSDKLPENIVVLTAYDLNRKNDQWTRSMIGKSIIIMGDTVVMAGPEPYYPDFRKNPICRKELNYALAETAHRKPGEIIALELVGDKERENIELRWYVPEKDGKQTPLEVFKQVGYHINKFNTVIEEKITPREKTMPHYR